MSFFPFIDTSLQEENTDLPLYVEIAWDFNKNIPIVENGEFKLVEGNEAIKVWVRKAILTNRYAHLIYSFDYGSELTELIGDKYTKGLTKMEAKRFIEECLQINPYIRSIEITDIGFINENLKVKIQLETVYGEAEVII